MCCTIYTCIHKTRWNPRHRGGVEASPPPPPLFLSIMRLVFLLFAARVDFPVALFLRKCLRAGMAPTALISSSALLASSLLSPPRTADFRIFLSRTVHILTRVAVSSVRRRHDTTTSLSVRQNQTQSVRQNDENRNRAPRNPPRFGRGHSKSSTGTGGFGPVAIPSISSPVF